MDKIIVVGSFIGAFLVVVLNLFAWALGAWLVASAITSSVKALTSGCGVEYMIEKHAWVYGDFFCSGEPEK